MKKKILLLFFVMISLFSLSVNADKVDINSSENTAVNRQSFSDIKNQSKSTHFLFSLNKRLSFVVWPMIFFASKAMDNSVIYGQFMNMDKYLWQLWQVMRSFANFLLWFLFIVSIVFYFFWYKQDKFSPKKIIPSVIVWVFLIQASWYLIALLIDFSTILTISIWNLASKVMYEDKKINSNGVLIPVILWDKTKLDTLKLWSWLTVWYVWKDKTIYLPCTFENGIFSWKLFNKTVDSFNDFLKKIGDKKKAASDKCYVSYAWKIKIVATSDCKDMFSCVKKAKQFPADNKLVSYSDLVNEKWLFAWPLSYLFLQILNFGWISNENIADRNQKIQYLIPILIWKAVVIFMLLFPLFVFTLIMIFRVVILWFVIIFSPFIFLFQVLSIKFWKFAEKFSLNSILTLIFMPVIVNLALWFGILILQLVNNNFLLKDSFSVSSEENKVEYKIGKDLLTFSIKSDFSLSYFQDLFWWFFMNIFGIIILWSLVFAAMKTSKFTESFVEKMRVFGQSLAMTVPVVPLPGWKWIQFFSPRELEKLEERARWLSSEIISWQYDKSKFAEIIRWENKDNKRKK